MSVYDDLLRRLGGVGGLGPEGLHGMSSGEMERQLALQRRLAQGMQQTDRLAQQQAYLAQQQRITVLEAAAKGRSSSECCPHGWYLPSCPACRQQQREPPKIWKNYKPAEPPVEYPGPLIPHPTPEGRGLYFADLIPPFSMLVAGALVLLMVL